MVTITQKEVAMVSQKKRTCRKQWLSVGWALAGILVLTFWLSGMLGAEEISLAIHKSPWYPAYETIIKMYEQETGNKININTYPHRTLYEKQILAAVYGESTYDIMHFDNAWTPFFMGMGYSTPLKKIDPDFELPPGTIDYACATRWSHEANYATPDGTLYGVPVNANIQLFFYRGDKYKEAGLATPPETWSEVITAAEKLHKPPSTYGYAIITVADIQAAYFWLPVLWTFGGDIFADIPRDWSVAIDSPQSRAAVQFDLDMKKFCPPGIGNTSQHDVLSYLANGQLLQAINVSATYPYMDNPEFAAEPGRIEFAPVPMKKEIGKHFLEGGGWYAVIPKGSKHKKAALDFLKWSLKEDVQMVYAKAGGIVVREQVYRTLAATGERKWRFCKAYVDAMPHAKPRPMTMKWPKIVAAIGTNLQDAVTGKISVDTATANMAKEIEKAIAE